VRQKKASERLARWIVEEMLKKFAKFVVVLLLTLPLAAAQETRTRREGQGWAEETISGALAAAKNLRVKVDVGSVRVQGDNSQSGIHYVVRNHANSSSQEAARRELESYKITAYVRGDTAWIVADWEGGNPHRFVSDFSINVPRDMDSVKVETEGGSLSAAAIAGRVEAESGGGSIKLDDIGGAVSAETGGGSIDVGTIGGDVNLHTGGGSIRVDSAKGRVSAESGGGSVKLVSGLQNAELETGGGSIEVERCAGRLKASTGGGSIDLGEIDGGAELETGGGSIRLSSAKGPVRAETGSGTIELNGVPAVHAETGAGTIIARFITGGSERPDSLLETSVGDVTVYLPSDLNITIRAAIEVANGHSIRSDFSDLRITSEGGDYGPKTVTAEGNLNGGGPVLKIRTTTGNINIRRASR